MTLFLKNDSGDKYCQMKITEEHIRFLQNFGVEVAYGSNNDATIVVEDPGLALWCLRKINA